MTDANETAKTPQDDDDLDQASTGEFFDDRCPKRREAARKSADTKAYDDVPTRRDMTFGQRLSLGFEMLDDDPTVCEGEE